ncbi:hypothetical protein [Enterobacter roggenkampii]|uniref:hypothetical protein n=1 Tax=Enterobacter roggenkampii TaxID=1812935 RepID=UPI00068EED29|nr:hypothetical protein [Enterobacter roggenkampii]
MSTITKEFTKEQLIEKLQRRVAVTANYPDVEEAQLDAAIFKIALASLEAEAYGYVHKAAYEQAGSCGLSSDHEAYRDSPTHIAVYTAPTAPVALTSGYSDFEEIWSSSTHPLTQDDEMKDFAWDIWNACRAAMLQGAEHNRPDAVDANLVEALRLVQCMLEDYRERNYGDAERWIRHIDTHMSDYSETHGDDAYSILHDLLPAAPQQEA